MYWSRMKVRFGIVTIVIPRFSLVMFCGKPNGSQYRAWGSLVPPGLNLPIGLFRANICCPNGVNGGAVGSALPLPLPLPPGTLAPESGPAHVPDRSRFGAGRSEERR